MTEAVVAPPWFAWQDARRETSFVAWGCVDRFERAAQLDFAAAKAWRSAAGERIRGYDASLAPSLPLAVGGLSFTPTAQSGVWSDWPSCLLFVPRFVAFRDKAGRSGLIVRGDSTPPVSPRPCPPSMQGSVGASAVWRPDPGLEGYERLVRAAVNDIDRRALRKVVVARQARSEARVGECHDPLASTLALRSVAPAGATLFATSLDGRACFLGASPETLVRVQSGRLQTQAVAGTSEVLRDPTGEQLVGSRKDRHEHALVVDSIEAALDPVTTVVERGREQVVPAGAVQHLVTPISGQLAHGRGVLDALAQLHPTAALCGTPRRAAAQWIAEHEPIARGWYGAPIGWIGRGGDGVFSVAIRSALLSATQAVAFAGAGIVRDSDPRAEWLETEAKLQTATQVLRTTAGPKRGLR